VQYGVWIFSELAFVDMIRDAGFLLTSVDMTAEKRTPFPYVSSLDTSIKFEAVAIDVNLGI
jgi:hypothetical protein